MSLYLIKIAIWLSSLAIIFISSHIVVLSGVRLYKKANGITVDILVVSLAAIVASVADLFFVHHISDYSGVVLVMCLGRVVIALGITRIYLMMAISKDKVSRRSRTKTGDMRMVWQELEDDS